MSVAVEQVFSVPTEPGLYRDVPAEQYHRWPYASQSILKILRDKSPAHAYQQMTNPPEPKPVLRLGDAVHTAVLQPDVFAARYAAAPAVDRRTKAGKAEWEAFLEEHEGKTILTADEWAQCTAISDAVRSHTTAAKLLAGEAEQSAIWRDSGTSIMCKGRFDVIARPFGAIVDLKTTTDASPSAFTRSIYGFGYYMQGAMYLGGAQAVGIDADLFAIIAVEKEPPYAVAVYQIEAEALKAGRDELRPLLETYARCQESGIWPGYDTEPVEISLPPWSWRQIEERVGVNG